METIALSLVVNKDYIDIYDNDYAALKMVLIDRENINSLNSEEWAAPGFYILLSRVEGNTGAWTAYVGKAPAGVKKRVSQHVKGKEFWNRALLVRKDTSNGFSSAEAGWLESRFYDLLDGSELCQLENTVKPVEDTLPQYVMAGLERSTQPVLAVLRLLEYSFNKPEKKRHPSTTKTIKKAPSAASISKDSKKSISVVDLLNANIILPGTLISQEKSYPGEAELNPDGSVTFLGDTHNTLSGAALQCRRRVRPESTSPNGWDFWGMEDEEGIVKPLSVFRNIFAQASE